MTRNIKISIVIATRNRTTELVRAIRSVMMQEFDNKQIITSDDRSEKKFSTTS